MASKTLGVPYLSQLDNEENPYGSCNVSSIAMCLLYFRYRRPTHVQLEDVLYRYCGANALDRHRGDHLATLFNYFADSRAVPYRDTFTTQASMAQIKKQINGGYPVVIHTYLTSGHIVVVRGYDDSAYDGKGAFLVNDPYGEWHADGYEHGPGKGDNVAYSYDLIERVACDKGSKNSVWAHIFSRVDEVT